jgi:hypothetical protein
MFGFFAPRCPVNIREKTWIELRMQWLIDRLGSERIAAVKVVTPSPADFPDPYAGSDEDIRRIFAFICQRMRVPRDSVELQVFDEEPAPIGVGGGGSRLGVYEQRKSKSGRHIVWIERSETVDLRHFISTAAHELAHSVLLGESLLKATDADHEFITDLLPVQLGFGIFGANAVVREKNDHLGATLSWWSVAKTGYLPPRMFGYALAVFAWLRDDEAKWSRYLRADPRSVFKAGLAYLRKTNDCLCRHPSRSGSHRPAKLSERLSSDNAGLRLDALWELRLPESPTLSDGEWNSTVAILDDRDPIQIAEAAWSIVAVARPDRRVVEQGIYLLPRHESSPEVLSAVSLALATQREVVDGNPDLRAEIGDQLFRLLDHPRNEVVVAALTAVMKLVPACDYFGMQQLLRLLRQGIVKCDDRLTRCAVQAILVVSPDPQGAVGEFFREDAELSCQAHAALNADIENDELSAVRLPTRNSLPVPLPGWKPNAY